MAETNKGNNDYYQDKTKDETEERDVPKKAKKLEDGILKSTVSRVALLNPPLNANFSEFRNRNLLSISNDLNDQLNNNVKESSSMLDQNTIPQIEKELRKVFIKEKINKYSSDISKWKHENVRSFNEELKADLKKNWITETQVNNIPTNLISKSYENSRLLYLKKSENLGIELKKFLSKKTLKKWDDIESYIESFCKQSWTNIDQFKSVFWDYADILLNRFNRVWKWVESWQDKTSLLIKEFSDPMKWKCKNFKTYKEQFSNFSKDQEGRYYEDETTLSQLKDEYEINEKQYLDKLKQVSLEAKKFKSTNKFDSFKNYKKEFLKFNPEYEDYIKEDNQQILLQNFEAQKETNQAETIKTKDGKLSEKDEFREATKLHWNFLNQFYEFIDWDKISDIQKKDFYKKIRWKTNIKEIFSCILSDQNFAVAIRQSLNKNHEFALEFKEFLFNRLYIWEDWIQDFNTNVNKSENYFKTFGIKNKFDQEKQNIRNKLDKVKETKKQENTNTQTNKLDQGNTTIKWLEGFQEWILWKYSQEFVEFLEWLSNENQKLITFKTKNEKKIDQKLIWILSISSVSDNILGKLKSSPYFEIRFKGLLNKIFNNTKLVSNFKNSLQNFDQFGDLLNIDLDDLISSRDKVNTKVWNAINYKWNEKQIEIGTKIPDANLKKPEQIDKDKPKSTNIDLSKKQINLSETNARVNNVLEPALEKGKNMKAQFKQKDRLNKSNQVENIKWKSELNKVENLENSQNLQAQDLKFDETQTIESKDQKKPAEDQDAIEQIEEKDNQDLEKNKDKIISSEGIESSEPDKIKDDDQNISDKIDDKDIKPYKEEVVESDVIIANSKSKNTDLWENEQINDGQKVEDEKIEPLNDDQEILDVMIKPVSDKDDYSKHTQNNEETNIDENGDSVENGDVKENWAKENIIQMPDPKQEENVDGEEGENKENWAKETIIQMPDPKQEENVDGEEGENKENFSEEVINTKGHEDTNKQMDKSAVIDTKLNDNTNNDEAKKESKDQPQEEDKSEEKDLKKKVAEIKVKDLDPKEDSKKEIITKENKDLEKLEGEKEMQNTERRVEINDLLDLEENEDQKKVASDNENTKQEKTVKHVENTSSDKNNDKSITENDNKPDERINENWVNNDNLNLKKNTAKEILDDKDSDTNKLNPSSIRQVNKNNTIKVSTSDNLDIDNLKVSETSDEIINNSDQETDEGIEVSEKDLPKEEKDSDDKEESLENHKETNEPSIQSNLETIQNIGKIEIPTDELNPHKNQGKAKKWNSSWTGNKSLTWDLDNQIELDEYNSDGNLFKTMWKYWGKLINKFSSKIWELKQKLKYRDLAKYKLSNLISKVEKILNSNKIKLELDIEEGITDMNVKEFENTYYKIISFVSLNNFSNIKISFTDQINYLEVITGKLTLETEKKVESINIVLLSNEYFKW